MFLGERHDDLRVDPVNRDDADAPISDLRSKTYEAVIGHQRASRVEQTMFQTGTGARAASGAARNSAF
jgi:hypothetical protein